MRAPVTRREKEIWEACETLYKEQATVSKITGDAIRETLLTLGYKKGSPNEAYRYRKTWLETRGLNTGEKGITLENNDPAVTLPDPLNLAVQRLREGIFAEAEQKIEQMQAIQAEENASWEAKHQHLLDEKTHLQHAYEAALSKIEAQEKAYQEQGLLLDKTKAALQDVLLEKEALAGSLSQLSQQLASLESVFQETQIEKAQLQTRFEAALAKAASEQAHQQKFFLETHTNWIEKQEKTMKTVELSFKEALEQQRHGFLVQLDQEKTLNKKMQQQQMDLEAKLNQKMQEKALLAQALVEAENKAKDREALLQATIQSSIEQQQQMLYQAQEGLFKKLIELAYKQQQGIENQLELQFKHFLSQCRIQTKEVACQSKD